MTLYFAKMMNNKFGCQCNALKNNKHRNRMRICVKLLTGTRQLHYLVLFPGHDYDPRA